MEKDYVGIILPDGIYQTLMEGKNQINVEAYQSAGEKYNLIPVFFRVKDIKPGCDTVCGFIKNGNCYQSQEVELPKVIYSRSFLNKRQKKFLEKNNILFYNKKGISQDKYKMHQIISEDPKLCPYLPHTMKGTLDHVKTMMEKHSKLILKPTKGSLGCGIMKLEKNGEGNWHLYFPVARKQWEEMTFTSELPDKLTDRLNKRSYIIQEQINLAKYHNRAFDLRVVVQRDETGEWVLAGILCKVAADQDRFVTNISQGGSSLSFDQVFKSHPHLSYEKTYEKILNVSIRIAKHLEHYTQHIADIALDLAIDQNGHLYFIESNFRGRYGNARYKGKRLKEWLAKHSNPLGYARFLLDQKNKLEKG